MYRQIEINPEHRRFQHILWRATPSDAIQEFELNTVTYGVNCAPYLALRTLKYIADHDCADFPLVRQALQYHTYVDDICFGADSVIGVRQLQKDLISVLNKSGMDLKKWSSNLQDILEAVVPENRACGSLSFDDEGKDGVKVLGLRWNHRDDFLYYSYEPNSLVTTKRGMLSLIARIFNPLCLISPVVFLAKQLMQRVWKAQLDWDDQLPTEILDLWCSFISELPSLQNLTIPRFIHTRHRIKGILCGFCDASERGCAAMVYLRIENASGPPSISMIGTKTKLAPMKSETIPRLELCAAVLLARWMARIHSILSQELNIMGMWAWSDSTIVLSWLSMCQEKFKIFVSNRIFKIHSLIPDAHWSYIPSADNPADCASRGMTPLELMNHELYWHGPDLLSGLPLESDSKIPLLSIDQLPDVKPIPVTTLSVEVKEEWFDRFSSYWRMIRVVARLQRVLLCHRKQIKSTDFLTRTELDQAANVIALAAQASSLGTLLHELKHNLPVSCRPIACLRPFIDTAGLIRVGGRLVHSDLSENQKHPILVPKSSHMALLFVRHWHELTGHSGPRVLTSIIGRKFWIPSIRSLIRHVVSKCTKCVRLSGINSQPLMSDLPRSRVSECRPFSRVGIDFAGPFLMREQRLRKSRHYKVYIAVFVCFTVKAIHLEFVSELSTDAFLAALSRFVARRGLPNDIFTDCITNFIGAQRQLYEIINRPENRDIISAGAHSHWHFNLPSAPHFVGLWEAAVRSAKMLMVRIMGEQNFTLEEFSTMLCRIEGILNSRPLTPSSSDPSELDCLTPGHFLIGQPLLAVPEETIPVTSRKIINRWKLLNQCVQSFWRRWHLEYLQTLQTRTKWTKEAPNLMVNDLVVIKDSQNRPIRWSMARIIQTFPGSDGVVRVARVRTTHGELTRPIVKLVKLPTEI
ncbi:uncharacterized protein LOC126909072 [Daktulosphaira vitifoliae]|uniref:uncharacterized protein LOC126909072 n=1 Tax=Daktulosphaira vitifoliae TaxID=58002 RepID=UPI0021AA1458|nr:uncharacterized protein LOC126909072 [Daktulosphaira vitifoliae]